MTAFTLSVILLLPAQADPSATPRKPNPLAPSLPQLTDEEEDRLDAIIDRFIQYDLGLLKGEEGKKALEDFRRLGPEAIPALIRGLNRAAEIEGSCPAVLISKKLMSLLNQSSDVQLLDFARETIGAGVTQPRHRALLQDLRVAVLVRKRAVLAQRPPQASPFVPPPTTPERPFKNVASPELSLLAARESGDRFKQILSELEQRPSDAAVAALAETAASKSDPDLKQLARLSLVNNLCRQSFAVVRNKLKDDRAEVRAAAALAVGIKGWRFGGELIELLDDSEADVRQSARQALVQLSKGQDFGPDRDAGKAQRAEAIAQWRAWWAAQGK